MIEDAKRVIAFVFEKLGKKRVSPSEFYLTLSMDLRWCSIEKAKRFLRYAADKKLLSSIEGKLYPNFPLDDIEIPFGFRPKIFDEMEMEEELKDRIVHWIAENTGMDADEVWRKVENISAEKSLHLEVAALLYANRVGLDVRKYVEEVMKHIENEPKEE
jgi:hypothetical protein